MSRHTPGPGSTVNDDSGGLTPYLRLALTAGLVAAFALGLALGLKAVFPGLGQWEQGTERVAEGVFFAAGGQRVELGGLSRYEAAGVLEEVAASFTVLPRDAYLDRVTKGVIPELRGRRLDVSAVVDAAVKAAAGQAVGPVYYGVDPAVTLADFPEAPVYEGNPAKDAVAVILNVAWGDEFLEPICTLVEGAGGRLTICPVGVWLEGNSAGARWLAAAASRGHEIGNHGYFNRPMTYAEDQVREELRKTSDLIEKACGRKPVFFAPPMGAFEKTTLRAAAADGYRTVLWSLDTVDWRLEGADVIAGRVISRVKGGDIILCHPTAQTGPAMEKFLPVLADKGLRVVTLSELLSPDLPADSPAGPGSEFGKRPAG